MNRPLLDAVIIGPQTAECSVIWLHGLGADGYDFEPIVPDLHFTAKSHTRFIFPHAPMRPVTLNQGYVMPAWYDIVAIDKQAAEDEPGIRDTAARISDLIAREQERGVPSARIVLAGFSQGGAIALYLGLRFPQRLAGILALSTYLPVGDKLARERAASNLDIPIYMAHGEYDPVVPMELARISRQTLMASGYHVDWHVYPMEHSVCPAEIEDISTWFDKVLTTGV
ncbi:MAG: carboxylesterase [Gammaproteobacteria bacterium]|nr:carboxylesterase [Gammaproteobacteria bacterium]